MFFSFALLYSVKSSFVVWKEKEQLCEIYEFVLAFAANRGSL